MVSINEEWKNIHIKGLDYSVSSHGRVKGLSQGRLLKIRLDVDGYPTVTVGGEHNGRTSITVHRLVAKLFVDNPDSLPEVNHIDFDRTNNHFMNLEWMTHEDNIKHTVDNGRHAMHVYDYTGKNNHNYGNDTLKIKYSKNPDLALEKQSRPGVQNGRCQPIAILDSSKKHIKSFDYIGQCAEYMRDTGITKAKVSSIRNRITLQIKKDEPYLNHYFKFL